MEERMVEEEKDDDESIVTGLDGFDETYSESEFKHYLNAADDLSSIREKCGWVFRRESESEINAIVKRVLQQFMSESFYRGNYMIQFWAAEEEGEQVNYLITSDQPFAVVGDDLYKGYCWYRKQCLNYHRYNTEMGAVGRAYRSKHPEFSPDLRLYSTSEFQLRDHAAQCGLRGYMAIPIFDFNNKQHYYGVLEFLSFGYHRMSHISLFLLSKGFRSAHANHVLVSGILESEAANLRVSFQASHMQTDITDRRKLALREIKEALKVVIKIPQLHMVQVWATCTRCPSEKDISLNCMELTDFMQELALEESIYSTMLEFSHIHTRKGITGMVLASENKSCFFRTSCHFSIVEQRLAHFTQNERIGSRFAICLQSTHTGNLVYVLEFFLNQGPGKYEYILSLLNFLIPILKRYLKSFTIASGQQLGDELAIEVPVFPGEDELILSEINGLQNKFKFVPYSGREHQHSGHQQRPIIVVDDTDSVTSTSQAEHLISSVAVNAKKIKKGKKMKKTGRLNLTLEALKPHFGTKLKDVAKELGVSISTIKRTCREYGIDRWPCNENHKKNPSLFEVERADTDSQKNICLRQNLAQASTDQSSSSHLNVQTIKDDTVIVKAKYDDDTIRFELGLPLGMEKLVEEVTNRLKLEMGSFKLKYLDEENEEILLTRDSDLLHCPKYPTASGESFIMLFVRLSRK
ncbi:hypothetical protein ABFX02_05G082400 [Erythranthe guttata]